MSAPALIGKVVEWGDLGATVVASIVAGVGISVAFAVAIYGAARFTELRRDGETVPAVGAAIVSGAGLAVCLAGITFGMIVMLGD